MGWNNPAVPWSKLERTLSGRPPEPDEIIHDPITIDHGDGGDTPSWTRKRPQYEVPEFIRERSTVEYAELHCHSNFSFLDGASHPEELAEEATRLGLSGLALTDHDGFYGVVRFSEAAQELGLPTIFGAELSFDLPGPQNGEPDPVGAHLLVLARGPVGYARLSRVISEAQLAGKEKGRPRYDLDQVADELRENVLVLTGCRKGMVPKALLTEGVAAAARELERLTKLFGEEHVAVELTDHGDPRDDERNDDLAALATRFGLKTVATNNVHYATPSRRRLATALAAVRARRSSGRDRRLAAGGGQRVPAWRCGDGATVRRLSGGGGQRGRVCAGALLRPLPWSLPNCPTMRSPPGTPRCPGCVSSPMTVPWRATAPAPHSPTRTGRSTTSST